MKNRIKWYLQETEEDSDIPCHTDVGRSRPAKVSRSYNNIPPRFMMTTITPEIIDILEAQPISEYIEKKFDAFVLALQSIANTKHTRELTNEREYFIKLTPNKIQNWCQITKQELLDLSILELVDKYTAIKYRKNKNMVCNYDNSTLHLSTTDAEKFVDIMLNLPEPSNNLKNYCRISKMFLLSFNKYCMIIFGR